MNRDGLLRCFVAKHRARNVLALFLTQSTHRPLPSDSEPRQISFELDLSASSEEHGGPRVVLPQ